MSDFTIDFTNDDILTAIRNGATTAHAIVAALNLNPSSYRLYDRLNDLEYDRVLTSNDDDNVRHYRIAE